VSTVIADGIVGYRIAMTSSHARPQESEGLPSYRVGQRQSSPILLLGIAMCWVIVALICDLALHMSWRLIPTIFALGVGLLYLRSAGAGYLHSDRS
jgi:hypothetical protein